MENKPSTRKKFGQEPIEDATPVYYLTIFKIEGNGIYRAAIKMRGDAFDREIVLQKGHPKITEKRVFILDRVTGSITAV